MMTGNVQGRVWKKGEPLKNGDLVATPHGLAIVREDVADPQPGKTVRVWVQGEIEYELVLDVEVISAMP
jgi:hypothetical protein